MGWLDELFKDNQEDTKTKIILEQKGEHVISAVINYFSLLEKKFSKEECEILQKKFFLSLRSKNPTKFIKTLKNIKNRKNKSPEIK